MSSKTTNFNLHKIDLTDAPPDITVLNQNWDTIDQNMVKGVPLIINVTGNSTNGYSANKTYSEMVTAYNAGRELRVIFDLVEIPLSRFVSGSFFSFNTVESMTQTTITITTGNVVSVTEIAVYGEGNLPEDSRYVKKSGDTMIGSLEIKHATPGLTLTDTSGVGGSRLYKNASAEIDYGTYITDTSNSDGTKDILVLNRDEKVNGKLYLRSDTEDGASTSTYAIYGEHNTHIKVKTYSALSEIGLTAGSETIQAIATNLPNNSLLICGITTNNAAVYPSNYGLLTVKRSSGTRIEFGFVTTAGASYVGFYNITSSGDTWTGWKELAKASESAKMQVVSHTGTGTYGASNPTTLTFSFAPKVVVELTSTQYSSATKKTTILANRTIDTGVAMDVVTTSYSPCSGVFGLGSSDGYIKKSSDGKTLSFYSGSYASDQCNSSAYTYYFLALG